jgi:hypothetical protein
VTWGVTPKAASRQGRRSPGGVKAVPAQVGSSSSESSCLGVGPVCLPGHSQEAWTVWC